MKKCAANRRRSLPAVALALLLVASACGSRRTHEELIADAKSIAGDGVAAVGTRAGATNTATASGAAADTVAGVSSAAAGATGSSGSTSGATSGGGATDTGAASGGGVTGAAAKQCTGSEPHVKIGTVGEQSGVFGGFIGSGPQAVQAWAAMVNAKGGINCHPVDYTIADDGGDPARNQALTQKLVEQNGVVAIVHANAPVAGQASVGYLTSKGIPVIGDEAGSPWFYESPVYRPQVSSADLALLAAIAGAGAVGVPRGLTKVGTMSCIEAPICSTLYELGPDAAPRFGMQLVFRYQGSLVQPDYTSACQQAKSSGAQMLVVAFDPNGISRLKRNCQSVGYDPVIATGGPLANRDLLADPALDGSIIGGTFIPSTVTDNPTVAEFQKAMAQYAPGVYPDAAAFSGWLSAKMFEAAATAAGDDLTPSGILNGLATLNGNDLNGATMPLSFSLGQNASKQFCYWVSTVTAGAQVTADGGARHCD